jgi:hypothetical protein
MALGHSLKQVVLGPYVLVMGPVAEILDLFHALREKQGQKDSGEDRVVVDPPAIDPVDRVATLEN